MIAGSARRVVARLIKLDTSRLNAYLNFLIFCSIAGITSLTLAFTYEISATKSSKHAQLSAEIARLAHFQWNAANETSWANDSNIAAFHNENVQLRSLPAYSTCKAHPSIQAQLLAISPLGSWASHLGVTEQDVASLSGRPPSVESDVMAKKFNKLRRRAIFGEILPPIGFIGVEVGPIANDWNKLGPILNRGAQEAVDISKAHFDLAAYQQKKSSDLVIWLFLLQVAGYLIITSIDAVTTARRNT